MASVAVSSSMPSTRTTTASPVRTPMAKSAIRSEASALRPSCSNVTRLRYRWASPASSTASWMWNPMGSVIWRTISRMDVPLLYATLHENTSFARGREAPLGERDGGAP